MTPQKIADAILQKLTRETELLSREQYLEVLELVEDACHDYAVAVREEIAAANDTEPS